MNDLFADLLEEAGMTDAADELRELDEQPIKYQPAEITEEHLAFRDFCWKCQHNTEENPCTIVGKTMAFDVDDPEYPSEWIYGEHGPECTKFVEVKP